MATHVFIVDSTTFKIHLEYLFAGTGAKDNIVDFNNSDTTDSHPNTENMLVGMIADASRIRQGDYVIFYLQQDFSNKIFEGKFYGIFKAKNDLSFLDNLIYKEQTLNLENNYNFEYPKSGHKFKIKNKTALLKTALTASEKEHILKKFSGQDKRKIEQFINDFYINNQYLLDKLEKSLTFRTLIEPYKVYPEGVTEWEALDEIKNIQSPHQMLWSLIYRKLKGNRGNTMITIYESERLCQLIRNKNNREEMNCSNKVLSFDSRTQKIICIDKTFIQYVGRSEEINVLPRLIARFKQGQAFESQLQAYIVKNIGKGRNRILDNIILEGGNIEWLGNEVSCGVGMQRIDVMLSILNNGQRIVVPIELKAVEADESNIIQIRRYIDWIEQYYVPNRQSDVQPVLISKKIENKATKSYRKIIESFKIFNATNRNRCNQLKFVEFFVQNNDLEFEEIVY